MVSEAVLAAGASVGSVVPLYVYLFKMNRSIGRVEATCRHNAEHLERLNDDVDRNRERLNDRTAVKE